MNITLKRTRLGQHSIEGSLWISGERICDTTEHILYAALPDCYAVTMQHFPFIHGNGIHTLRTSRILVGEALVPGVVTHCRQAYDLLRERIRKAISRHTEVTLTILPIP